jgi:predicted alpha/beta superfamily hydrolase
MLRHTTWRFWFVILLAFIGIGWLVQTVKPSPYRTGNVSTFTLHTKHLNDHRRVWVYLPPGYKTSTEQYPVLILHDGQNVFDGKTSTHEGMEWRVDETLERMITAGEIPPLIAVAVDSTDTRHDEYLPERVISNGVEDGGRASDYAAMLKEELLPYLKQTYRVKDGPNNTFVGGSSYGGVLSFYLAMEHSDTFGAALVVSPSTSWNNMWMKRTAESLFWKHDVKLWLDYGFGEFQPADFFMTVDALREKGWRQPYDMMVVVDGGYHFEAAWARRFPAMMQWLFSYPEFAQESQP